MTRCKDWGLLPYFLACLFAVAAVYLAGDRLAPPFLCSEGLTIVGSRPLHLKVPGKFVPGDRVTVWTEDGRRVQLMGSVDSTAIVKQIEQHSAASVAFIQWRLEDGQDTWGGSHALVSRLRHWEPVTK